MNLNHGSGWIRVGPKDPNLGQVWLGWSSGEKKIELILFRLIYRGTPFLGQVMLCGNLYV